MIATHLFKKFRRKLLKTPSRITSFLMEYYTVSTIKEETDWFCQIIRQKILSENATQCAFWKRKTEKFNKAMIRHPKFLSSKTKNCIENVVGCFFLYWTENKGKGRILHLIPKEDKPLQTYTTTIFFVQ